MKRELPPQEYQRLSEYLDGQLSAAEAARLEARLKIESDLREELDALRVTRQMLRSAPKRRAPRSFALTPQMVAKVRPAGINRWFTTFRFASALAALLLVVMFAGDLVLGGRALNAQPQSVSMEAGTAQDSTERTTSDAQPFGGVPPMVTWGTPTPDYGIAGNVVGMGGAAPVEGKGGGGGGGDGVTGELQPGPIVEMTLPPTQPTEAPVELQKAAAPTEEASIAAAPPEASAESREPVASGPILGMSGGTPYPTVTAAPVETPARSLLGEQPALRAAEIALAVIAIAAGLAAFYFARKPAA